MYLNCKLHIFLKGECIGQGTYQDLSKTGIDFMALLIEEEEEDSAIESDDEPNLMERKMKRTLSRLHSRSLSLARADSVQSRSSHKTSLLMESQLSILTSETEVSIFVSLWLDIGIKQVVLEIIVCYFLYCKDEDILPKESKQEGAVTMDTYLQYFKSLHSLAASTFVLFLFAVTQVFLAFAS